MLIDHVSNFSIQTRFLIPAHIGVLYYSYYMACTADPGIITANNHQSYMDHYKYDNLLYEPKECTTCKRLKPARSKHCSMCHACVGRSDHHCAWINRCVGVNNHRYFFFFLYSLIQLCVYGTYLCFEVYRGFIVEWGLENATVFDHKAKTQRPITFRQAMVHVMHQDRIIGSLGILATVVAVVVSLFLVYQLYLAGRGMTTNEAFKWEIVEEDIDRGVFYLVEEPVKTNPPKRKDVHTQTPPKERRIKSFSELENIYDLGFVTNIKNVLIPPTFGKP
ncbi:DHHC palmitoyltransferase-domain-containing protein [Phycomyces blakesleeanus]|uniref:Palmitoyltransferase n=1 Tax=Phycomyces blakesleeanus TaxID=4837 RepID=A0ABR3ARR6_PHYBL